MISVMPAADEDLSPLLALAAAEFPDLPIDAEAVLQVHRWSKSIFAVKDAGTLVGGVAALFLNAAGKEALLKETLPMNRPPPALLARSGEDITAVYVWMFLARKNGSAAMTSFLRVAAALAPTASIYGRPVRAGVRQFFSERGAAPLSEGSQIWALTAGSWP